MYLRGVIYKIQGRNNKSGDTVFELKPSPIGAVNYRENGHNITCKGLMVYYPVSTPVVMEGDYDTSNNIFKFHYIAVDFREYSTSIAFLKTFASIGIDTADSLYHKINYLRPYPFTSTYSSPNTPVQDLSTDVKSLNDIVYINKTEKRAASYLKVLLDLEFLYNELKNMGVGYSLVRRLYFARNKKSTVDTYDTGSDNTSDNLLYESAYYSTDEEDNTSDNTDSEIVNPFIRGVNAINDVLANPYILLKGNESRQNLAKCDSFVVKSGTGLKYRINAVIHCIVTESRNNGNSRLDFQKFVKTFFKIEAESPFKTDTEELARSIYLNDYLVEVHPDNNISYIWLKEDYDAEESIVKDLQRLNISTLPDFDDYCNDKNAVTLDSLDQVHDPESKINLMDLPYLQSTTTDELEKMLSDDASFKFSKDQARILNCILQYRGVKIITGPPGSGKSTLVKAIITKFKADNRGKIVLCAPTGAAAVRLMEVTGRKAVTIHRLLKINPFVEYDEEIEPLDYDLIIVDESSMLELHVAKKLLSAVKAESIVILMGDKNQLPPVGVGNVFEDLIKSGKLEVYELKNIHRQAERSGIAMNSRYIIDGISDSIKAYNDFRFISIKTENEITKIIGKIADYYYPRRQNVRIFSPVRKEKYAASIKRLNQYMGEKYKVIMGLETSKTVTYDDYEYFEGEPIIFTFNDYDIGFYNGEDGVIKSIVQDSTGHYSIYVSVKSYNVTVSDTSSESNISVSEISDEDSIIDQHNTLNNTGDSYVLDESDKQNIDENNQQDEQMLELSIEDLANIEPSFVVTAHKAQGTECDIAIVIVPKEPANMLQRRLLYTEVTRAKKMVIVISVQEAFMTAVRSTLSMSRNTGLVEKLCELDNGHILTAEEEIIGEINRYI